jgi:hypothetical protein
MMEEVYNETNKELSQVSSSPTQSASKRPKHTKIASADTDTQSDMLADDLNEDDINLLSSWETTD